MARTGGSTGAASGGWWWRARGEVADYCPDEPASEPVVILTTWPLQLDKSAAAAIQCEVMASVSQGAELACPCHFAGVSSGMGRGQPSDCWHLLTPLQTSAWGQGESCPRNTHSSPYGQGESEGLPQTQRCAAPVCKAARGIPALICIFY